MEKHDRFLNINQASLRLTLKPSTVYSMIQEGRIYAVRMGRKTGLRVRESEVERYISEREAETE